MKTMKFNSASTALLSLAIGITPAAVFAQDPTTMPPVPNTQPNSPSAPSPQDSAGAPGMTGQMMRDKLFLRTAVEGGLLEVKLGELAAQKGSTAEVKDFGQKMATDHAAMNADFGTIADSMGVMVPKKISKDGQAEYAKLEALSGSAFDTEYLTVMVKDHHQDLREFRQEITATTDTALQAAVVKAGKVVREHTMMVDKLATEKGIPVPAHKPSSAPAPQP
jgi:putative membrane protein